MRNLFRNFLAEQTGRDRVLFAAPIAMALFALFLVLQDSAVIASAWRDPLAVLAQRSPGERQAGALYNTKPLRIQLPATQPSERVLSIVREPPALPEPGLMDSPGLVLDDTPLITQSPVLLAMDLPVIPLAARFAPDNTNGGIGGGGTPSVLLGTPVPEPATWAMNIVGLFAAGAVLRYRNRRRASGMVQSLSR